MAPRRLGVEMRIPRLFISVKSAGETLISHGPYQPAPGPISSCPGNVSCFHSIRFPTSLCLYFLTLTTIYATIRARHNLSQTAFFITFYISDMLMIICFDAYERLPENSQSKERLKAPSLIFMTATMVLYVYGVSKNMDTLMAFSMWCIVGLTSILCYYGFFGSNTNNVTTTTTTTATIADRYFMSEV